MATYDFGAIGDVLLSVVVNLMLFFSFLLVLLVGGRIEDRWSARRRSRLHARLRADGHSPASIAAADRRVEFVVTHGTPFRAVFGLLAVTALGYLSLQSTNRTLLAASYAGAAALFVAYALVEGYRYVRARRVRATLWSSPDEFR